MLLLIAQVLSLNIALVIIGFQRDDRMDEEKRVKDDIVEFDEHYNSRINTANEKERVIFNLAKKYRDDSEHYMEKGDLFSAFGCITYAHGLLDGILALKGEL